MTFFRILYGLLLRAAAVHFLLCKDAVFAKWGYCTRQPVVCWLYSNSREGNGQR